jgi:nitroreductase
MLTPVERAIKERRSVRAYRDEPVPEELLQRVLEAARWAPSGVNAQPWHFVVVRDKKNREFLSAHSRFLFVRNRHISEAPVSIIICGDPRRSKWYWADCSLAGANIMLAAHALGLGTCWIGIFDAPAIKKYFAIPDPLEIVAIITLGYPEEMPDPPTRLPLEKIVHYESFDPSHAPSPVDVVTRTGPLTVARKILKLIFRRERYEEADRRG